MFFSRKQKKQLNNKGFTLMEIVVAIGLVAIFSGLAITSLSVVPKARMRENAQSLKTEFELTRNFAKSHGGNAAFKIIKESQGVKLLRTSFDSNKQEVIESEIFLNDKKLEIFYTVTGDVANKYQLGTKDYGDIANDKTIEMVFSQTQGAILGPDYIDTIFMSNGNKDYTFHIKHSTGMIYYDYELNNENQRENDIRNNGPNITLPQFIDGGTPCNTIAIEWIGDDVTVQPELQYDARNIKIGGVYRASKKGVYTIVFSLKDPYKTQWVSGDVEDKTLTWEIN